MRHGRRLLPAALGLALLAALALGAEAQRVVTEPPRVGAPPFTPPGGGGIGGGAGLIPKLPSPALPSVTAPPLAVPAPAVPAPAAPARVVRFRCDLAPEAQSCKEPGSSDGGGGDEECNCARDYCHTGPAGNRVCEKLQ